MKYGQKKLKADLITLDLFSLKNTIYSRPNSMNNLNGWRTHGGLTQDIFRTCKICMLMSECHAMNLLVDLLLDFFRFTFSLSEEFY